MTVYEAVLNFVCVCVHVRVCMRVCGVVCVCVLMFKKPFLFWPINHCKCENKRFSNITKQ